jgi:NADP-dependent 3-hydroxy acid dehydrogenase YdfG
VTDRTDTDGLAAFAVENYQAIDVLVNNAGIMPLAFFSDHAAAADAWDRCIDVNIKGVLHGISAVYDQMIAQGRARSSTSHRSTATSRWSDRPSIAPPKRRST